MGTPVGLKAPANGTYFVYIMAPLARSGILTVLIFAFLWSWNDLLLPAVFIQSPDKYTIAYAVTTLRPAGFRTDHVVMFAASIISTGPMIVVYLLLMRRFIAGLTVGGLRG